MQTLSPVSSDPIGQILSGAYRVEARIDQGAMGTVFRAEHIRLKRPVAVKLMAAHLADQPGAVERFSREAEIISSLSHPNIVQVLDFNTTPEGQPFLVMELLRGRPLDSVIEQHQRLDLRAALRIALQAASGLAAAHAAGVVHRDLKPANIFLVDAGDQLFAKLLDFGISKQAVTSAPGRPKLTGEFDILGTPEYMPPEQALGRTALVDHRGDQYALAVILYEMLVGHTPFSAEDILALLQKVIRDEPSPPSQHRPDVPPLVDEAILRALRKTPNDRFETIADFADVLDLAAAQVRTSYPSLQRTSDLDTLGMAPRLGPNSTQRPLGEGANGRRTGLERTVSDRSASGGSMRSGHSLSPRLAPSIASPSAATPSVPARSVATPSAPTPSVAPPNLAFRSQAASLDASSRSQAASLDASSRSQAASLDASSRSQAASASTPAGLQAAASDSVPPPSEDDPSDRRRTSWHSKDPVKATRELIDRARQELGLDSFELALSCAESAVEIAIITSNAEVKALIQHNSRLLERIFRRRLGSPAARLHVGNDPIASLSLSPAQAFLMSRLEGNPTVDEALDLSPWPREQTLGQLVGLVRAGYVSIRP